MYRTTTKNLCTIAALTALQIVMSRYVGFQTLIVHLSFGFLPLVVTAIHFGVWPAVVSASVADVANALLYGGAPYFPGFTLSAALSGLVYALLLYKQPRSLWRIALAVLITSLAISLCLSTYWVQVLTGKGFLALLPARILQNVIMVPVKFITIWLVAYRLPVPAARARG